MAGALAGWFASLFGPAKALANSESDLPMIATDDPRYDRFLAAHTQVWTSIGAQARGDLAQMLISSGTGLTSPANRRSVLA